MLDTVLCTPFQFSILSRFNFLKSPHHQDPIKNRELGMYYEYSRAKIHISLEGNGFFICSFFCMCISKLLQTPAAQK